MSAKFNNKNALTLFHDWQGYFDRFKILALSTRDYGYGLFDFCDKVLNDKFAEDNNELNDNLNIEDFADLKKYTDDQATKDAIDFLVPFYNMINNFYTNYYLNQYWNHLPIDYPTVLPDNTMTTFHDVALKTVNDLLERHPEYKN